MPRVIRLTRWSTPSIVAPARRGALQVDAAGGLDPLAGDPTVVVAEDRGDRRADVVGDGVAAERRVRGDRLLHRRGVADHAAAEVGGDRTRGDHVDADPARAEFGGEVTGGHLDRTLDRAVGDPVRVAEAS